MEEAKKTPWVPMSVEKIELLAKLNQISAMNRLKKARDKVKELEANKAIQNNNAKDRDGL